MNFFPNPSIHQNEKNGIEDFSYIRLSLSSDIPHGNHRLDDASLSIGQVGGERFPRYRLFFHCFASFASVWDRWLKITNAKLK